MNVPAPSSGDLLDETIHSQETGCVRIKNPNWVVLVESCRRLLRTPPLWKKNNPSHHSFRGALSVSTCSDVGWGSRTPGHPNRMIPHLRLLASPTMTAFCRVTVVLLAFTGSCRTKQVPPRPGIPIFLPTSIGILAWRICLKRAASCEPGEPGAFRFVPIAKICKETRASRASTCNL